MNISSFRELKVWQLGMDLAERVYMLTRKTIRGLQKALKAKLGERD